MAAGKERVRLAVTCGDPAGVGPEVIEGWFREHPDMAAGVTLIGPAGWLERLEIGAAQSVPVGPADFHAQFGKPTREGAAVALQAMEAAAAGCREGRFDGVVTGPVSKSWLQEAGLRFPGQTEFFAARWGGSPTMAFSGGGLRVALLSWHVPLRRVFDFLNPGELERTVEAAAWLARAEGAGQPRIGVCGLNPHAGEAGLLGDEEQAIIDPILARLRVRHPGLSSCQPADTLFFRMLRGEFDVLVALYHDQGLAPLKAVAFDEAVNVTLGLPYVRTSPDHGTAFDLAGSGRASARSFGRAVELARRLAGRRG